MKKTFTINLNNIVFHIDSDAYETLRAYLTDLNNHFTDDEDGVDILKDIEARIAELFQKKMDGRKNVVTSEDVDEVIETMGRPSQFGDGSETDDAETEYDSSSDNDSGKARKVKKLYRDIDNRLIGGVAAGIAAYFKWDVAIVRVILFVLIFLTQSSLALVYIVLSIIIPKAVTTSEKLEMHGEDVNVSTIKSKASDEKDRFNAEKFKDSTISLGGSLWSILKGILKLIFTFVGVIISIIGGILIALLIFTLIIYLFEPEAIMRNFPELFMLFKSNTPDQIILLLISLVLIIGTPLFALNYWSINILSGSHKTTRTRSKSTLLVAVILWFVGIFMFAATGGDAVKKIVKFTQSSSQYNHEWFWNFDEDDLLENSEYLSEERKLAVFHEIRVNNAIQLEWTHSEEQSITVTTLSDFVPNVQTEVNNGVLRISSNNRLINPKVKVHITSDSLHTIRGSGASKIILEEGSNLNRLKIKLNGASRMEAQKLSAQNLNIDLSGASKVELSGTTSSLTIDMSGASNADLEELEATAVQASVSGASNAKVYASDSFEGKAAGASKIDCYGSPNTRKDRVGESSSKIRYK